MLCLPSRFCHGDPELCAAVFQRSRRHAEVLLLAAILAPGKRTVTSLLQISGPAREQRFVNDHRMLNRRVERVRCVLPVARPSSYHALPARLVLPRHLVGKTVHASCSPCRCGQHLISQAAPDLLRHARRSRSTHLAQTGLRHVRSHVRCSKTPPNAV